MQPAPFRLPMLFCVLLVVALSGLVTAVSDWTKLTASNGVAQHYFGQAVALSEDTAIVSAVSYSDSDMGEVYAYTRSSDSWVEQQLIATTDTPDEGFGYSVAVEGDTAIVGDPYADPEDNINQGAVYIFTRTGTTWTQQANIIPSDAAPHTLFGRFVAIDGNTLAIAANVDTESYFDPGAVYVFTRSNGEWTQEAKLTPDADFLFGGEVAVDGDTLVISSVSANDYEGAAYVFTREGETWTEQAVLTESDPVENSYFGHSAAVEGDTILIGSPGSTDDKDTPGAAYVYTRSATAWSPQQKLTPEDSAGGDRFGYSAALNGSTALIGAVAADMPGGSADQGAAYVFSYDTMWTQREKLIAQDGAAFDIFGGAVALDGSTALVGATGADVAGNDEQGAAYIFTLP